MNRLLCIALLAAIAIQMDAYVYTFKNESNSPVKMQVRLAGFFEPMYESDIIAPGKTGSIRFAPGEGSGDMSRKFGLCLREVEYAAFDKKNGQLEAWQPVKLGDISGYHPCGNKSFAFTKEKRFQLT